MSVRLRAVVEAIVPDEVYAKMMTKTAELTVTDYVHVDEQWTYKVIGAGCWRRMDNVDDPPSGGGRHVSIDVAYKGQQITAPDPYFVPSGQRIEDISLPFIIPGMLGGHGEVTVKFDPWLKGEI